MIRSGDQATLAQLDAGQVGAASGPWQRLAETFKDPTVVVRRDPGDPRVRRFWSSVN